MNSGLRIPTSLTIIVILVNLSFTVGLDSLVQSAALEEPRLALIELMIAVWYQIEYM